MKLLLKIGLVALLAVAALLCGVYVGITRKPPYSTLRAAYRTLKGEEPITYPSYETIAQDYWKENIEHMIEFESTDDILARRQQLIDYVWNGQGLPKTGEMTSVETSIQDARYGDLDNLRQIDKLVLEMGDGINSVIYLFRPSRSNNKLLIYHQGHKGDFFHGKANIRYFVEYGFTVMAFAMPLKGLNRRPLVNLGKLGRVRLKDHNYFRLIDSPGRVAMRYYLEPIARGINFATAEQGYDAIYMVGISGGGATAILYSSLDPRVSGSYPVNTACIPLFLRPRPGDYEKSDPTYFRIVNWPELYIMASYGEGRRHLQIWNQHDPGGVTATRTYAYRDHVRAFVDALGAGTFDVYLDPSNQEHSIGREALEKIRSDIGGGTGPP